MRATYAVVSVLMCLYCCSSEPSSDEMQDFSKMFALLFEKILPIDKIKDKVMEHLDGDEDFRAVINYMQQDSEWKELLQKVADTPEWLDLKELLNSLGVDVDKWLDLMSSFVNSAEVTERIGEKNLNAFLEDLKDIIPADEIKDFLFEDETNSKLLNKVLWSKKFKEVPIKFLNLETVKAIVHIIESAGIPIIELINLIITRFDWGHWDL